MESITINGLCCEYATHDSPRVCYLLTPIAVDPSVIDRWAKDYATHIVVVSGMDWNADMTPWRAPNVKSKYPDFPGHGPQFAVRLADTMDRLERLFKFSLPAERTLIGTSLSGLFGTWAWLSGDLFQDLLCISGSFWYPGFVQWLRQSGVPRKDGRAYFSLGDRERLSRNPLFASIEKRTDEVVELLREAGVDLCHEKVAGAHHGEMVERIDRGMSWLKGGLL